MALLTVIEFEECTSTNDEAWRALERGISPVLVTAERQTAGRGRQGRSWVAGNSGNVSISLGTRAPSRNLGWVSLAAGVAAVEALERALELVPPVELSKLRLKWPNDLYWADAKLGGILCESRIAGNTARSVVIGLGLNLASSPSLSEVKTASIARDILSDIPLASTTASAIRHLLLHDWSARMLSWIDELDQGRTNDLKASWLRNARLRQFGTMQVHDRAGNAITITALDLDSEGRLKAKHGADDVVLDQPDSI